MQRLWARAWIAYLAAGVLTTTVYFMLGPVPAQNVIYDATALSSALAILIGIRRWNPTHRTPWVLLAAAQGLMFLGELVYDWYDLVRHVDASVPSLADAGFLAAYPFLIAGVVMLTRDLSPRSDRGTIVDATIVATGLGLLWWILVVLPTTRGSEAPFAEQLTTLAYPLMDVLLLFVLVRLAFERGVRTPAFRLLTLSIIATLAADVAYALTNLVGGYVDGSLMDLGWMAGFLLMGAAALHPSMGVVADQDDEEGYRPRFGRVRIAMLTVASLMAPVALAIVAVEHAWDAVPAIVAGSAALFGMVVIRMSGLFRDVQSKVEELDARGADLEQAEARYRTVVEHIPAVTFIEQVDRGDPASARTVYVSPQVDAMFGYSVEEWIRDRPWSSLIEEEDRDRILEAEAHRIRMGEPLREEYRIRSRDGHRSWVHSEIVLVGTTPDERQVWQGVMFDVTGHKLAEQTLRNALGREREAAARLRALDDMKSTFLHAVSHELRTPLAAIMGAALTLDRDDLTLSAEDQRDLLRRMASNSRKLDRLLADLLDLNRLDRGIVEPDRRMTDIGALARSVVAEYEALGDRRVEVDAEPGSIDVDPAQVERILENLVANAVRHTPPGTRVWIKVSLERDGALLAVEDSGPGVPRELRATVFEPFAQGPSPNRHSPGVGIGLSLVARFAELHGGRAWVEERDGGGASFRVFIPGRVRVGPDTTGEQVATPPAGVGPVDRDALPSGFGRSSAGAARPALGAR